MKLIKPEFWKSINLISLILAPLSLLYLIFFHVKWYFSRPISFKQKVICLGNATIGGSGKTPIALSIAEKLKNTNKQVAFISRGYKGRLTNNINAILVNPSSHTPLDVGEEALLLAKIAPTYINKNRCKSAALAAKNGADFLIMDDGMQNNSIKKSFVILVVDGDYGFGNYLPLPAGPMRELLFSALPKCNCIVVTGERDFSIKTDKPIFFAKLKIKNVETIPNQYFIAMCGIGNPKKFFNTLKSIDLSILHEISFPDHHTYNQTEIIRLIDMAKSYNAKIITTSKDFIKIPVSLRCKFIVLDIEYELPEEFYKLLMHN